MARDRRPKWRPGWCRGCNGRGFFLREMLFGEEEFECWNCDGTGRV